MAQSWQWLLNRGVDDTIPPNEARYIIATNMIAAVTILALSPIVVLGIAMALPVAAAVTVGAIVGYGAVLWLNHRQRERAAATWLAINALLTISANYLLVGRGYVFYIVVAAAMPLMHPPRRKAIRLGLISVATILFVASTIHAGDYVPFIYVEAAAAKLGDIINLIAMGILLVAIMVYGSVIANRTETELHNAQAQLIESEKTAALARLVAGILHEVNTPLGAIRSSSGTIMTAMGRASDLLGAEEATKEHRRALRNLKAGMGLGDTIEQAVGRIAATVDGLERFVNLDGAEQADVDVRISLDDAIAILGCSVSREYEEDLPPVRCAAARLNHVLLEVLQNAMNAAGEDGAIRVSARRNDGRVVVEVADDGPGIPEDKLAQVFDIGFSSKGGRVSMKLGLPMAKRHVEEFGGTLSIESSATTGTTVRASLPASA